MDTQRLLLYMALSFLGLILYQTWQHDYNRPEVVPTEVAADGVTPHSSSFCRRTSSDC